MRIIKHHKVSKMTIFYYRKYKIGLNTSNKTEDSYLKKKYFIHILFKTSASKIAKFS